VSATIIVTGASRGIGLALTEHLCADGHRVFAGARRPGDAPRLAATGATVLQLDVGDDASVTEFAAAVAAHTDHVDVLVNNAAIKVVPGRVWEASAGPLAEVTSDAVLEILRINVVAPLMVTQALHPLLTAGRGVVANISSNLSSYALSRGVDYAYNASKTALNMLTVTMHRDLQASGISAVAITPGWVRTDMGGAEAPLDLAEVSRSLADLMPRLGPEHAGTFIDRFGDAQPW
jgi:NAD(P)-dependent dehydrogenase (short-subunit alcohol dehydrogenase family)